MELSSSLTPFTKKLSEISFSSSLSPFPLQLYQKPSKPNNLRIFAVAVDPSQDLPRNSPQRLLKELAQRKKVTAPRKKVPPKRFILKPPLDDKKLTERFLNSPQLSLKQFPLLSSCLPSSKLNNADQTWIDEYLLEAKQALGYPLEKSEELGDDNPAKQFDTLLYLAFQHPSCDRTNARHVRSAHSRLSFLGQYVLELALAEFFLQRYPRDSPGPMRERVFGLIGKRNLPKWIKAASLQNLIFPYDDMDKLIRKDREPPVNHLKMPFLLIQGYSGLVFHQVCIGFGEISGIMTENLKLCRPWGIPWQLRIEFPKLLKLNIELGLGLQLCFMHPSKYKFDHPRFCFERTLNLENKFKLAEF